MPDLDISVTGAEPVEYAAAPTLAINLGVSASSGEQIENVILQCQVRIEAMRRQYSPDEKNALIELFGTPDRWGQTLRSLLWAHVNTFVPRFTGSIFVDLPLPCTFDLNVAITKYLNGLATGEIPLLLLFSGTVFYRDADGSLQTAPIDWAKEAAFRLPVEVWRDMMDHYYPNQVWTTVRKDVFERLNRRRLDTALLSLDDTLESLLDATDGIKGFEPRNRWKMV